MVRAGVIIVLLAGTACTSTTVKSTTIGHSSVYTAESAGHEAKRDRDQEAVETYIQLGLGYLSKGERQRSRANFLKAFERDENSVGAHGGIALLYQLEQENLLAEKHFLSALELDPKATSVRNNYAIFLYRQQRYGEASRQFSLTATDLTYARRGQVFLSLGLSEKQRDKLDSAIKAWEKALRLNPSLTEPHLELADASFYLGDYVIAKLHLDHYRKKREPSARSLWLALRLERIFGNRDGEESRGLALEKLFPYSQENLEYQIWRQAK